MKVIIISILSAAVFAAIGMQSQAQTLIPGSDKAKVIECSDSDKAYLYDDYLIYTQAAGDFDGSNIYIFSPSSKADPCKMSPRQASYFVGVGEYGGVNKFIGKYEDLIFLDQWTGRNFKRLIAINVQNKSLVFLDTYAQPEISSGDLNYFKTLKAKRKSVRDKIPCPQAQEWEAQGKQVLYVERMSADLNTMKKVSSDEFSCMPAEPIANIKPSGYGH